MSKKLEEIEKEVEHLYDQTDRQILDYFEKKIKKDVKGKLENELFDIDVTSSTEWKEFWKKQLGE